MFDTYVTLSAVAAAALVSAGPVAASHDKRHMWKYCQEEYGEVESGTILNALYRVNDATM
ncbi:hypothetical protein MN608_11828 [Microdochium nivale]|nr:hypothetical protein MN608_11828 [Microdochium nivale]